MDTSSAIRRPGPCESHTILQLDTIHCSLYVPETLPSMRDTERLRDPVHGLIVFDMNNTVDRAAWKLIDTPEFQRLRRIKQLGFSEFVFPGATHSRFVHSVGVFHVARQLMKVTKQLEQTWDRPRCEIALLAALLHDVGHGPFSHAFERAEEERLKDVPGAFKKHETWTANIIKSESGQIRSVLNEVFRANGNIANDIADLLIDEPRNIYSAVVSSSFDADRLDYLQRDKLMTGSGAGGIDFDWLKDNLRTTTIGSNFAESFDDTSIELNTFCFAEKASQAVEAFLMARYQLFSQVYHHKTTRGFECLLAAFLQRLNSLVKSKRIEKAAISGNHPLVQYYQNEEPVVSQYLDLDDTVIWSALDVARKSSDEELRLYGQRLRNRRPVKSIEINQTRPTSRDRMRRQKIDELIASGNHVILEDRPKLSVYSDHRREDVPLHKRVYVQKNDGSIEDVVKFSKPIGSLRDTKEGLRYYFLDESLHKTVSEIGGD